MSTLRDSIKAGFRHALGLPDLDTIETMEQDTQTMIEHIEKVMKEVKEGMQNREALPKVHKVR
jgi:hypothetical protein